MYVSTKTYSAERGLSTCFRQWRADSHCSRSHGYALGFHLEFASLDLDARNWTVDFGGLKDFKGILDDTFDHTMLVAEDDPHKDYLLGLQERGLAKVVLVQATGCEAMAKLVFEVLEQYLKDAGYGDRVKVLLVEVREHGANSAKYINPAFAPKWPVPDTACPASNPASGA